MKTPFLRLLFAAALLPVLTGIGRAADPLAQGFASPPASARPWVFWFWINGNISKPGITADLEAMKRVGVGGVLWMEVSGPWWAPEGPVRALSPEWHDCMQWALRECDRLGLQFDLSVDFGYGSGGPHITPELSMQKLYWSETELAGGSDPVVLPRPTVPKNLSAWLRPGAEISPAVRSAIENSDGYRDVAVLAFPAPASARGRAYRIPELNLKDGTDSRPPRRPASPPPEDAVIPLDSVLDLTNRMSADGKLDWVPPAGQWLVLRVGHASNFKMTRPSPAAAVGLECDRLATAGIDAHFGAFVQKIFAAAGPAAGRALTHVHVDSWEAGGQNWTATFPAEFRARRGYEVRRWLPVLTGRVVGGAEMSDRFLWDVRMTVSDLIRDNYARRLRELARPYGIHFSTEAYGRLCIDNLAYAGTSDFPISEFWAMGNGRFPVLKPGFERSTKAMASAAHTYGRPVVGAEAFTSDRGWQDHPFLLKGMGDEKFCEGLNRVIFHLSAHQPYERMVPGLTHRKWGEHIQRHNTWFEYSRPWMEYLARCQHVLQQGEFVADVACWVGEGAPLSVNDMSFTTPRGYDFDLCSSENVLQFRVDGGRLVLPSGASYRYLVLPDSDRMTVPLARKIRELAKSGARIVGAKRFVRSPGLTGYPQSDAEVAQIGEAVWRSEGRADTLGAALARDGLPPDFEGGDVEYVHRRVGEADVYFVSNQENRTIEVDATFRVSGRQPELWDPETGAIRPLPDFAEKNGRVTLPLQFAPMQSWFVVFRTAAPAQPDAANGRRNFAAWSTVGSVAGPWEVNFDSKWGGPPRPVAFAQLTDWSAHREPGIRFYSGTAVYKTRLVLPTPPARGRPLHLDLGAVEVMGRVRVNGKDCGIAWKPPYRVDISHAVRVGENELEIAVVNLWVNRMIGDEQLPLDSKWKDFETLLEWPEWFQAGAPRTSGRYTFTSARHYQADSPLSPSGLLGPVTLKIPSPAPSNGFAP